MAVGRNSTYCQRNDGREHVLSVACVGLHWLFRQEFLEARRLDWQSERVGGSVFFVDFMFPVDWRRPLQLIPTVGPICTHCSFIVRERVHSGFLNARVSVPI